MIAQIVLFDEFDLLDVVGPYEVLVASGQFAPDAFTVHLVSAEGKRLVPSGITGLELAASGPIDATACDVLIVPGAAGSVGSSGPDSVAAILGRALETDLPNQVAAALTDPNVLVATVCGGSLLLAMAGLIEGRSAVTHYLGMDVLDATGTNAINARIVDDGDLVSSGGVTSGIDLGLYLLERLHSSQLAIATEELFEFERRGTVWKSASTANSADRTASINANLDRGLQAAS
jgi:transcriptional regulator GlxA family with amidase domain